MSEYDLESCLKVIRYSTVLIVINRLGLCNFSSNSSRNLYEQKKLYDVLNCRISPIIHQEDTVIYTMMEYELLLIFCLLKRLNNPTTFSAINN